MVTTVQDTLQNALQVVAGTADASKSNLLESSGNWAEQCFQESLTRRAPFELSVRVQVRDAYSNQKQLAAGEYLNLSVFRGK